MKNRFIQQIKETKTYDSTIIDLNGFILGCIDEELISVDKLNEYMIDSSKIWEVINITDMNYLTEDEKTTVGKECLLFSGIKDGVVSIFIYDLTRGCCRVTMNLPEQSPGFCTSNYSDDRYAAVYNEQGTIDVYSSKDGGSGFEKIEEE
jgi:hypothetical protein